MPLSGYVLTRVRGTAMRGISVADAMNVDDLMTRNLGTTSTYYNDFSRGRLFPDNIEAMGWRTTDRPNPGLTNIVDENNLRHSGFRIAGDSTVVSGPGEEAYEATERNTPRTASEAASSMDMFPLVGAASMGVQTAFNAQAEQSQQLGTVSGRINANNLRQTGNDTSTGMLAGGMVGSMFDEVLGPFGTLLGSAIGGTIGGLVGNNAAAKVNTTGASVDASDNQLPF